MDRQLSIPRGSVEHLHAQVTAPAPITDSVTVSIAIGRDPNTHAYVWLPAAWQGEESTSRTAVTTAPVAFSTVAYPEALYVVYIKLVDAPEAAVITAGTLTLV